MAKLIHLDAQAGERTEREVRVLHTSGDTGTGGTIVDFPSGTETFRLVLSDDEAVNLIASLATGLRRHAR